MLTKNDFAAPAQSEAAEHDDVQLSPLAPGNRHSQRRRLWKLGAIALVAAFAIGGFAGRSQQADVPPLQIIPLAQGYSPDHNVILHLKGPSDVLQTDLIFQPGGTTGWHTHPGPVLVVIKSGALTEIHSDGCLTVHAAGTGFFEEADVVHNVVNNTPGVTEVYATFLSPAGAQPLIPASNPGGVCRN